MDFAEIISSMTYLGVVIAFGQPPVRALGPCAPDDPIGILGGRQSATPDRKAKMPTHSEKRTVPYTADEMYALIADVGRYPEFLPWCAAARVRETTPLPDGTGEVMEADLVISFKVYREKFGSRVTLHPEARTIDVEYLKGPFRYLQNHWRFTPHGAQASEIDFFVDFEFRSAILQKLIGLVFHEAMLRIVRAFERRAEALYGKRASV
jgi:coenzyme Q-binding protein COQ10